MWSAITEGAVTLREMETEYSFDDFLRLVAYREYTNDVRNEYQDFKNRQASE